MYVHSSELLLTKRPSDPGHQSGCRCPTYIDVGTQSCQHLTDGARVRMFDVDGLQGETRRCGDCRMRGRAPADQEGGHASGQRVARQAPT
jgi:hypothetical protein